ncbi:MAG: nuclear transport factor 2 family protein [Pseudomonadota bacterium]
MGEDDKSAIERLLSEFAWTADRGLGVEMAGLFLPHGTLTVNAQTLHGRQAIAADCQRRFETPGRKTRHVWANLRLHAADGGGYAGAAIQLTFESTGEGQPVKLRVNDVSDRFERDEQGAWRFGTRVIARQMAMVLPADHTMSAAPSAAA